MRNPPDTPDGADHFQRLLRLLALEGEAQERRALEEMQSASGDDAERSGHTLVRLTLQDEYAGLGGRVLVTLAKRDQNQSLPWNRLGVGTPVWLSQENADGTAPWRGVVSRQDRGSIQVALNQWPEPESERATFRLDRAADEVAHQRQRAALQRAQAARGDRPAELRSVLLGAAPPGFGPLPTLTWLDHSLNPSQQEAIRLALAAQDVAIIHGPPGTGKTTAVVELIRQAVRRGDRVIACAPSNLAVDNILERLLAAGEKALRLGHPARVLPELRARTLDLMVEGHPDVRVAHRLIREAHALRARAGRYTRAAPAPGTRQALRREARELMADARRIEAQVVERILDSAPIVCATTTGLDDSLLGRRRYDLCVLDEASQSVEPGAWIPLQRSARLVLAGDHRQLPPTVISQAAAAQGFGVSLMERLMDTLGPQIARQLSVQYRMHQAIMDFSSREFYAASLEAHPSVRDHLLSDLPGVMANQLTTTPVHFVDTAGAGFEEELEPGGESRLNRQEADRVARKVTDLLAAGVAARDIAVIAPYAAQVRLLRERLPQSDLEIDSVDGFQGREKEAVVLSLVRSNPTGEIGFLDDERRMNVALTRARRKLLVIGDSATVGMHPFYRRLIDYFEEIDAYHSVWEEIDGF